MIVTCGQCQTRFRIPEEKVAPDRGVKVRCTKCGHTFRVHRVPSATATTPGSLPPAPVPVGSESSRMPEVDPFARFGASLTEGPVSAVRPAERRVPAPFDFSAIAPLGSAPAPSAPAPAFDFSSLTTPPPPLQAGHPAPVATTPSFDFSSLGAPATSLKAVSPVELDERELPPPPEPPRSPVSSGVSPETTTAEALQRPPPPSPRAQGGAPVVPPHAQGDEAPPAEADAFFGGALETKPRQPLLDLPDDLSLEAAKEALFDLPAPAPQHSPPISAPVADAPVAPASAPSLVAMRTELAAPSSRELPRPPTTLGVAVNVAIALLLVVGLLLVGSALLNEGKLTREAVSLDALADALGGGGDLVAWDISNGRYETRRGRPVFFVRGQVTNRGTRATKVLVQADIVEAATVVRSAQSLVGAVPSPEELYELGLVEGTDLTALERRLAPRALPVEPGATAGFLVVFLEYPPDLRGFRVRVSARPVEEGTTATRP